MLYLNTVRKKVVTIKNFDFVFKGGSINYHRKVLLCQSFYVLSSCGLFWFNSLVRSVV